jgi:hypothetical protein
MVLEEVLIGVIVIGPALLGTVLYWKVKREGVGLKKAVHGTDILRAVKCTKCEGSGGAQTLYSDGWGPIHKEDLVVGSGSRYLEPKLANVRACPWCLGKGFSWVVVPVNHEHVPPHTAMVEEYQRRWQWPWNWSREG